MATIDLTLDGLRLPGLENFVADFGTKEAIGKGVSTKAMCRDMMLPFTLQRPVDIAENSTTGEVQAHRTLLVTQEGVSLELGRSGFIGCRVTVLSTAAALLSYTGCDGVQEVALCDGAQVVLIGCAGGVWRRECDASMPIGYVHVQYPQTPEPSLLWSALCLQWEELDFAGAFFRSAGGGAAEYDSGVQGAELPNVNGYDNDICTMIPGGAIYSGSSAGGYYATAHRMPANVLSIELCKGQTRADGTYLPASESVYRDGGEVRPENVTVRLWKRIA